MATKLTLTSCISLTSTFAVALLLFAARIATRIRLLGLWWDDYILCCAIVLTITDYGLIIASITRGFGRHVFYLTPDDSIIIGQLEIAAAILWVWSTALVRVTMALMLFRLKQSIWWRCVMSAMAGIQIACGFATTVYNLTLCTPFRANWEPNLPGARCRSATSLQSQVYSISGIFIASDVIFSFLPLTLIWTLQRRLAEKLILGFLMSLGLFATATAVVKVVKLGADQVHADPPWGYVPITLWGQLELYVGIAAVSLPCLKGPFEQALHRMGIYSLTLRSKNECEGTSTLSMGLKSAGERGISLECSTAAVRRGEDADRMDEERLSTPEQMRFITTHGSIG